MRRRSLVVLAVCIAAGLGVVAGAVLSGSPSRPAARTVSTIPFGTPSGPQPPGYGQWNLGIAYGTTPAQVLRQLGTPAATEASCWLYRGRVGRIRGRLSGLYVDAMKFCFGEGSGGGKAVTQIASHMVAHTIVSRNPVTHRIVKKSFPARWAPPIALAMVPGWYVQQNS